MDYPFSEEHRIFRKAVRRFVEEELNPHVDEWEAAGIFPKDVYRRMGELGFLGIRYDETIRRRRRRYLEHRRLLRGAGTVPLSAA
jgi:acyl-CoA dehydrogenase